MFCHYKNREGVTISVMASAEKVRHALKKKHASQNEQMLAVLLCVGSWNISDAKPTADVWRSLPIEDVEGIYNQVVGWPGLFTGR